jgi:hypothetical protein
VIRGDDVSARFIAFRFIIPVLRDQGLAIRAVQLAKREFADQLWYLDDAPLELLTADRDRIISKSQSTGSMDRMVASVEQGIMNLDPLAMSLALQMKDARLYHLVADQIRRHSSYQWVTSDEIGNLLESIFFNPDIVSSRAAVNTLSAIAESGDKLVRKTVEDIILNQPMIAWYYIDALNSLELSHAEYLNVLVGLFDQVLTSDMSAIDSVEISGTGDSEAIHNHERRYGSIIRVLGNWGARGFVPAQELLRSRVTDIQGVLQRQHISSVSKANIIFGLGEVASSIPEAISLIDEHYQQLGIEPVLPRTRNEMPRVASVVIDDFLSDQTDRTIVETVINDVMGDSGNIPSYRINVLDEGKRRVSDDIRAELDSLLDGHPDTRFVVNISKSDDPQFLEEILINDDLVRWGREGRVVVTVPALMAGATQNKSLVAYDNVIMVGGVTRDEQGIIRFDQLSLLDPSVSVMTLAETDVNGVKLSDPAIAAPRFAGLLTRALFHEPEIPVVEAVGMILREGAPLYPLPSDQQVWHWKGFVDVDAVLSRIERNSGSVSSSLTDSAMTVDPSVGGIDFDLRNIHIRQDGTPMALQWEDAALTFDYDGLRIERITIATVDDSVF